VGLVTGVQTCALPICGVASATGCKIGNEHPMAIGFATVDVVNSCSMISPLDPAYYSQVLLFDNVLTGDYDRINPDPATGNYAGEIGRASCRGRASSTE